MSTVKSKKLQVGTDATSSNNFTIYQPSTPDGTLRIGVGNADSPTEVGRFDSNGYVATNAPTFDAKQNTSQTGISASTWTKVILNGTNWNIGSGYNTSTGTFTAPQSGYYQVNATLYLTWSGSGSAVGVGFYKNGSLHRLNVWSGSAILATGGVWDLSSMVSLSENDTLELYVYIGTATNTSVTATSPHQSFNATLVRAS